MSKPFHPVNLLEQMFVNAASDPSARPQFFRELIDSDIFVLPIGEMPPIVDGKITDDAKITLTQANYDGKPCISFFTSEARLPEGKKYLKLGARDFFKITQGSRLFLNPGESYGKEFDPSEINRFLDGSAFKPFDQFSIKNNTAVHISDPQEYPTEIVAALSKLYRRTPTVKRAWIGFWHSPKRDRDKKEGCLLLCIETSSTQAMEKLSTESGMTVESLSVGKRPIDIVPYSKNGFTSFFTSKVPFYRRNLLRWLRSRITNRL